MSDAHWKVGTITVPSSTGAQSITGLGGTPKAVFFFGTNWTTEDAAVTTTGTGLFRGMAAPKYDDPGTILQNAAAVIVAGDAHVTDTGLAIRMPDTSGSFSSYLYYASLTSFDADGFTLSWGVVAAGYKVVYVALMDVDHCGSRIGLYDGTTISLGFKAGASLLHGAWGANPGVGGSDRTQEFYGGAAYPGTSNLGWFGAGLSAFQLPTAPGGGQHNIGTFNFGPHIVVAQGGHFTGPFLVTSNILAYPTGTGLTNFLIGGDAEDGGMVVIWDDEKSQTGRTTPATSEDGTATVTGLPFTPGLLIGYSISDEPQEQGSGSNRGAVGFAVVTPDYQWCALVDGFSSRGAFQSFDRGFVDVVNGSSVHAGTVELTDDGFVMTTVEDDVAPTDWVWHAFGSPVPRSPWIPQVYRRVVSL